MSAGPAVVTEDAKVHWDELVETHGRLTELADKGAAADGDGSSSSSSGGRGGGGGGGGGGVGVSAGSSSTRLRVLESQLQWYQAELDTAKSTAPSVAAQSIEESVAAVEHEVAKGFVGSADALQRAQDRLLLLEEQIIHERHLQEQHRDMATALQQKLDDARDAAEEAADSQRSGGSGGGAAPSSQQRQLALRNKSMMDAMNEFLGKHYPRPTPADTDPGSGAGGGGGGAAAAAGTPGSGKRSRASGISSYLQQPSEMLSMSEILEELMNNAITRPHAPYIVRGHMY